MRNYHLNMQALTLFHVERTVYVIFPFHVKRLNCVTSKTYQQGLKFPTGKLYVKPFHVERKRSSFVRIYDQSAQELGIEIRAFCRHAFIALADYPHVIQSGWHDQRS